jgi:hypothetical protein
MNSQPIKVPAAFDSVGRLPSEINVPFKDILQHINSEVVIKEGLEAIFNNDFSQLWEILDYAADDSRFVDAIKGLLGEKRPDYSDPPNITALGRVILTAPLLNEYVITSTVASCLKDLLDGKSEEMLRACWLGYVMAKRLSSASRQFSFLKEIPAFIKRNAMDRRGKKRVKKPSGSGGYTAEEKNERNMNDLWDAFIAAEQNEQVMNKGYPLGPNKFINNYGGEEPLTPVADGSLSHLGHLKFKDARCSKLPPITRKKLLGKLRSQNMHWNGLAKFIASCQEEINVGSNASLPT